MSVSILLVPAVIAAVAGSAGGGAAGVLATLAGSADGHGTHALRVQTRMRDVGLLCAALTDLGAELRHTDADAVDAALGDVSLELARGADGVWAAHVDAAREVGVDEANALLLALDAAYAARVQQAVAERIRQNADAAGFRLVEESREPDDSVRMVLEIRDAP
jgi:hypothetical protein